MASEIAINPNQLKSKLGEKKKKKIPLFIHKSMISEKKHASKNLEQESARFSEM